MYLNEVGWFAVPFGQVPGRESVPSKSRSPFWNRLLTQKATGECSCLALPLISTVRLPCLKQAPSENSQFWPLPALLLGQAIGPVVPSVLACAQMPVLALHGPSPTACRPSEPPMQVWNTCLSTKPPPKME